MYSNVGALKCRGNQLYVCSTVCALNCRFKLLRVHSTVSALGVSLSKLYRWEEGFGICPEMWHTRNSGPKELIESRMKNDFSSLLVSIRATGKYSAKKKVRRLKNPAQENILRRRAFCNGRESVKYAAKVSVLQGKMYCKEKHSVMEDILQKTTCCKEAERLIVET